MNASSARRRPSNCRFGLTLGVLFALLSAYGFIRDWHWIACISWLAASLAYLCLALLLPSALAPLNTAWAYLGVLLSKMVIPIVLAILFFGLLAPISCLARLIGRDALRLKRRAVTSYWISRSPPDATAQSFKDQF